MAKKPKPEPQPQPTSTTYPTGSQQGTRTMSQPSSFEDILNGQVEDFEAPLPTPAGTYDALIEGPFTKGESAQKKTPFLRFNMKLLSAGEDVDPEELSESDAIGRVMPFDLYVTQDSAFRIKEFLGTHLGISLSGKSTTEALAEAPGRSCKVVVEQEMTQPRDGSEPRTISRIRRTLAA